MIPCSLTPVCVDGRDKSLGLVVRRRINALQEVLNGSRPRMFYDRSAGGVSQQLCLVFFHYRFPEVV
jgi:hypothetical protein